MINWASVKKEEPMREGSYLVTTKKGAVSVARWYGSVKKWATQTEAITHWRDLPLPPGGKE